MDRETKPFSHALQQLFATLQAIGGIGLVWKDADPGLALAMDLRLTAHRHPWCMRIKQDGEARWNRCQRQCGTEQVIGRHARRARAVTCHAGCQELRQPVHADGELLGVVLYGPYRVGRSPAALSTSSNDPVAMIALAAQAIALMAPLRNRERHQQQVVSRHPVIDQLVQELAYPRHDVSLQELADRCHCSLAHLHRLCRDHLQTSLAGFRDHAVLASVQRALVADEAAIGRIAADHGFADQRYFATWFKRLTGMTASAWRQRPHNSI